MFKMKRVLAVIMCAAMVITSLILPSYADNTASDRSVTFAAVSGISYVSEANRGGYNEAFLLDAEANGYQYEQLDGLLDSSFAALKEKVIGEGLKYVLISGNLTYSGEYTNHAELAKKLNAFEEETGAEVIVMAGGGDVYNSVSSSFANGSRDYVMSANSGSFKTLYSNLGYDLAVSTYTSGTQTSAALSYSVVLDGGYRLIVIDGTYLKYTSGYYAVSGMLSDGLLKWIERECETAKSLGQTPIGMCSWSISGDGVTGSEGILKNADKAANIMADAGMHYIFTSGTGKNDIAAVVSDNGNVIYDIQTAPLISYPNTFRVSSFNSSGGSFDIVDADAVQPIVSRDGTEYEQPYRETSSLRIQYCDYDLARYCANYVKNYVGSILIPGVKASGGFDGNGTLENFVKRQYGVSLKELINERIGGGLNIFDSIVIFDATNIMNMLEDIFQQAQSGFLQDDDTLAELFYARLKTVFDYQISSVPCTKFLDTFGFGSKEHGGTVGDLLLSATVYSRYGNEDASDDAFVTDVIKNLNSGELVLPLVNLLADSLIRDLLFEDILSQVEMKPGYLVFLSDKDDSLGYWLQIGFRAYLALHGESASVTGAVNSVLKDGFFRQYGRSIDEVIDYFINYYFTAENIKVAGPQLALLLSSYVSDTDPQAKGDFNVKYDGTSKAVSYATKKNYRLPVMINITPGNDTKTEAYVTWYTKSTVTGTDIEIYSDENSTFYGKYYIGVPGVSVVTAQTDIERTYNMLDLGFASFGQRSLQLVRHTVKIIGLEPGNTYYFRVGDGSKNWWSETASVTTASDSDKLSFIHVADSSGNTAADFKYFNNILDCADYLYPDTDFILHTGNYVDNNYDMFQWQTFLDGASDKLLSTYFVPVAGSNDSVDTINNNFAIGALLGESERTGVYYSFDYNLAHITVLDSNCVNDDGTLTQEQLEWFKNDMSKASARWKIVAIHDAVYSNGESVTGKNHTAYMSQITGLMDKYNVDLVLSGSDGVYYRTDGMYGGSVTDPPKSSFPHAVSGSLYKTIPDPVGTVYSTLGASGSRFSETHEINNIKNLFEGSGSNLNPDKPMFTALEIYGDTLYLTTYTLNNNIAKKVDSVSIKKGATLMGDVNFDGRITAADARIVLRASANLELLTSAQISAADMNGDTRITAADARLVLRKAANLD